MLRTLIDARALLATLVAAVVGVCGLQAFPIDRDNPFLLLIEVRRPDIAYGLAYGYGLLWFSTPFWLASIVMSLAAIVASGLKPTWAYRPLPPYPEPEKRPDLSLVLGETHFADRSGRAPEPRWLQIPERGLYTGIMILGAVGTGKTSACMYPYVDQLLRWRADDTDRKVGALVMEVKGDFCHQVRTILDRTGRADDYIEVGLDTNASYNPLHNDLDPYAVAYAIATLLNNLFGKSKEPFWQQAYTDLLKFVILLRRITEGYTTFADVYQYILDDSRIAHDIKRLKDTLDDPQDVIRIRTEEYELLDVHRWSQWFPVEGGFMAHPYNADLDGYLDKKGLSQGVAKPNGAGWAERKHQIEALDRWYSQGWSRLDARLRSNITEGIVVFLSLFDDNPAVHRAFCPPRRSYIDMRLPGDLEPLQPLDTLLDTGKVLALNFPVAMNPGLARIIGVMLKLDFQRAVLRRIPKMTAERSRVWRDLLFVCDEYHAFATVGETDPTGDERTFALSRQARLIPIVATQSISSLRSVLPGDESWRTLLQCFRNKIFLATSDEFTARNAADLCGRKDRIKARYSLAESGSDTHVSFLTGRTAAARQAITATKSYGPVHEHIFAPRVFTELQNAQAIVLPYDGVNPLPPQYCYLKPHYLDVQTSYFDHVAAGAL